MLFDANDAKIAELEAQGFEVFWKKKMYLGQTRGGTKGYLAWVFLQKGDTILSIYGSLYDKRRYKDRLKIQVDQIRPEFKRISKVIKRI